MEIRFTGRPPSLLTPEQLKFINFINNGNLFIRSIRNNLVAEHLAEYLFFEDLKALTLVSSDCLNCFRNTTSFSTRARFTIRERTCNLRVSDDGAADIEADEVDITAPFHVLQSSTYNWRNLSTELGVPGLLPDNEILPERCLRSVESVLFYSYGRFDDAEVLADWLKFEPVLQRMEKLRELEVYPTHYNMFTEKLFSSGDVLQQIFSKVERLKIDADSWDFFPKFLSHEDHIQRLELEWNLPPRYFQLNKFSVRLSMSGVDIKVRADICSSIAKIVDLKKGTLEELQLHLDLFGVEEMKTMRLPNLKRLLFRMDNLTTLEGVKTFLQNQVPLEELRIKTERFPLGILQCLKEADKLGKMQKMCIKAHHVLPAECWTFVKGMRKLKMVHFIKVGFFDYHYVSPATRDMIDGLRKLYPLIRFNEGVGSSCFDFKCVQYVRDYNIACEHLGRHDGVHSLESS